MGSMSTSDAAPLPRLGEVFFDVRGESRSMRLSWYADTGVAVFSIWQGGTCTGTFRLPIADLPRMVEALQRGPHGRDDPVTGEYRAPREPRPPGPPGLPGPAGSPPEPLDGDIRTGQTTGAIYLPPVESDLTGYQAEPLPDYPGEYAADPLAPGVAGGYAAGPPTPEARGERRSRRRGREPRELSAEYAGEPLPPDPSHGYSGGRARHGSGEYQAPMAPGYPDEAPLDYLGPPDTAGYHDEPSGGYLAEESLAAGYHGDYEEGPLGAQPGGPGGDPLAADPTGGYPNESLGGRYPAPRGGPARRGYPGGPAGGMAADEDYAGGLPPDGYPDEQDYQHHHDELTATEYGSPVQPYAADIRGTDEPFTDDPPQRRMPRGRRRAEPTPDSFPYGSPPADDEPQERGPYQERH